MLKKLKFYVFIYIYHIHKLYMYPLYFILSHTIPLTFCIGLYFEGIYTYATVFYIFIVLPLLDIILGSETTTSNKKTIDKSHINAYKYILYSWSLLHISNVIIAVYCVLHYEYTIFEYIGIGLSLGVGGGQSIAVAHELLHKHNIFDNILSKILLFFVMYNHFETEHKYNHHINVATPLDPATAKINQSYYSFWKQSVCGGFVSALNIEFNHGKYTIVVSFVLYILTISLLTKCHIACGIFFVYQAFIGFSFLEISNYFEHYGLHRKPINDSTYEPVSDSHSWDNDNCASNWILFRLGRHADHHTNPIKEYQYLVPSDVAPKLITGYPGCALLSLIPPLWFYLVNPRIPIRS